MPAALLTAATDTLRQLGPRRFSLTAVAEAADVSRGTVHNVLGSRDDAIATALNQLAEAFVDTMASDVSKEATLAEQAGAAAVMICAHRQRSEPRPRGVNQGILVLLVEHGVEVLMRRAIERGSRWSKPRSDQAKSETTSIRHGRVNGSCGCCSVSSYCRPSE